MSCYTKFVQLRLPTYVNTYSPNILDISVIQVRNFIHMHTKQFVYIIYPLLSLKFTYVYWWKILNNSDNHSASLILPNILKFCKNLKNCLCARKTAKGLFYWIQKFDLSPYLWITLNWSYFNFFWYLYLMGNTAL